MPEFVSGLELAESLYVGGVRPILEADFPGLAYAAALIGPGSEVLGFDDATSTDHHWGPRLMLFLRPEDDARLAAPISLWRITIRSTYPEMMRIVSSRDSPLAREENSRAFSVVMTFPPRRYMAASKEKRVRVEGS